MDFRLIATVALFLGSFVAVALGVVPGVQSISESITAKKNVERSIRDLDSYFSSLKNLEADIKRVVTRERCERLNSIAPASADSVDLPQLLLQFDSLARLYGSTLLGIQLTDAAPLSDDPGSLKQVDISLEIPVSLENVFRFMDDMYYIERLVDVRSVKLQVSDASDQSEGTKSSGLSNLKVSTYSSVRGIDCSTIQ